MKIRATLPTAACAIATIPAYGQQDLSKVEVKPEQLAPGVAVLVVTYADGLKLHLNGEEVRVVPVPPQHTDGDSIIYWTKSNVIHMGDLFFHKMTCPFVDRGSGGSVRGVVAAADKALAMTNDTTKIIPGHGPVATKADLVAYRKMLPEIVATVAAGV